MPELVKSTHHRDCMCPVVLTRGSDQAPVSTKFDLRGDANVLRNYGRLLVELAAVIPDGIVCFFVSYSYMDMIISKWNDMGVLQVWCEGKGTWQLGSLQGCCSNGLNMQQILLGAAAAPCTTCIGNTFLLRLMVRANAHLQDLMAHKLVFIETVDVVETTLALDNFRRACDCGRGAVFLSVARGKVAEGIDFDRHYGRCVVMFGVPYQYTLSRILRCSAHSPSPLSVPFAPACFLL